MEQLKPLLDFLSANAPQILSTVVGVFFAFGLNKVTMAFVRVVVARWKSDILKSPSKVDDLALPVLDAVLDHLQNILKDTEDAGTRAKVMAARDEVMNEIVSRKSIAVGKGVVKRVK